jgi:hypothetical protein
MNGDKKELITNIASYYYDGYIKTSTIATLDKGLMEKEVTLGLEREKTESLDMEESGLFKIKRKNKEKKRRKKQLEEKIREPARLWESTFKKIPVCVCAFSLSVCIVLEHKSGTPTTCSRDRSACLPSQFGLSDTRGYIMMSRVCIQRETFL